MPWSKVLDFTDPSPYQSAIRAADVELYPTSRGEFSAELTQINLNQLWMQRFHEKLPQIFACKIRPGRKVIGFLTSANQPTFRHCGINLSHRDVVVGSYEVMHHRTGGDSSYGSMSLATNDFDAACRAIVGHQLSESPPKHLVRPSAALMSRLVDMHEMAGRIAKTAPDILAFPEVVRALEQELIHLMIRCLAEGESSGMTSGGWRHEAIIARFEEFLEANPDQPLYLTEICAAIGVAERTLRVACEEHLGMGPIRYLSLRRMHLVRRALLRADFSRATVTQVVTDHGFWELGRFSVAYRALFGESPSETLRRMPADLRIFPARPSSLESPILHHRRAGASVLQGGPSPSRAVRPGIRS
jgi:AraC-like DNA-binding protein